MFSASSGPPRLPWHHFVSFAGSSGQKQPPDFQSHFSWLVCAFCCCCINVAFYLKFLFQSLLIWGRGALSFLRDLLSEANQVALVLSTKHSMSVHPKSSLLCLVQFKFSFLVCRWLELYETPRTVCVLLESPQPFTCLCCGCKVWRHLWIHTCLCVCTSVRVHVSTHVHPHTSTHCFMCLLPAEELSDCSAHFYYFSEVHVLVCYGTPWDSSCPHDSLSLCDSLRHTEDSVLGKFCCHLSTFHIINTAKTKSDPVLEKICSSSSSSPSHWHSPFKHPYTTWLLLVLLKIKLSHVWLYSRCFTDV